MQLSALSFAWHKICLAQNAAHRAAAEPLQSGQAPCSSTLVSLDHWWEWEAEGVVVAMAAYDLLQLL